MKILNFIACEEIIRDAETERVSLINILEQINAIGFPAYQPKVGIFLFVEKEKGEGNIQGSLTLMNNGTQIFKNVINFNFAEKDRLRLIFKINGIAIYETGNLTVEFDVNGKGKNTLIIPIAQQVDAKNEAVAEEVHEPKADKKI